MEAPLHSEKKYESNASKDILMNLINKSSELGIKDIVIPCVDQSSLNHKADELRFIDALKPAIEVAEDNKINLSLETDLPPRNFLSLLNSLDSEYVTVNYDIGNSASLGFDPEEELDAYGQKITDIHIKDRKFGGGSVLLGNGDSKFTTFFRKLKEFNYSGPFIMQAYRDDEGLEIFKKQLAWIRPYLL